MFWINEEQIKKHYERKASKQIARDKAKTEYKKAVLENRKNLIPELIDIKRLKAQLKEPAIRRRISNILLLMAVVMTVVTTLTTISGGLQYRNTIFTMLTFILFVSFAQVTILVISCLKPYLYNKAPRYIAISTLLQLFLLIVSISFNYVFLYNPDNSGYICFLNIILCVIFDIVILVICEISFVIRLNVQFTLTDNRLKNIFTKLINKKIDNLENRLLSYKPVQDRLLKNPVQINSVEVSEPVEPVQDSITRHVTNEKIKADIKDKILKYKDKNIAPSTKKLLELTNYKRNEIIQAKNELKEDGFLKVVGNTTYINGLEVV